MKDYVIEKIDDKEALRRMIDKHLQDNIKIKRNNKNLGESG